MYKIIFIDTSKFEYSCSGELYEFESKPSISELRKDYWQNIRDTAQQTAYSICADCDREKYLIHYNEYLYGGNDIVEMFRIGRANNKHLVDILIDVDMVIVNPDWDIEGCNLYYHGDKVVTSYGSTKSRDRYISAFCYDVESKKLYSTKDGVGNVKIE